ncbi:protein induced by osmotic stress [Scheffersomyces coipomensis]|uniref:protein induced by osmotic stress n=1 Tax=Scheffersomyces coipomensis TaxID=1788519 RepID=UPI00315C86FF
MTSFDHIFISGATGYIALHIISQLLSSGRTVIGSVRSIEKGEYLVKLFDNSKFSYVVVPILEKEGAFDEALKANLEVTIFLHTASPLQPILNSEHPEQEILIPAIDGTKYVLKSIKEHAPQIKRVVYTSSIAACATPDQLADPTYKSGESTWTDISYELGKSNSYLAYVVSKTFAEREAWDFVKSESPNFTLSSINPTFAFGPQIDPSKTKDLNFSAQIVGNVLNFKNNEPIPTFIGAMIDVRDIAKAHILAFEKDEAQGKRFVLNEGLFTNQTLVDIIRKEFPQLYDVLPVGVPYDYDSIIVGAYDDHNARSILKINYISIEESVNDTIRQILEN